MNDKIPEDSSIEFTLRDMYYTLFRHKKKIIAFFFAVVAIFSLYLNYIPNVYMSQAQLLVKAGRESMEMIPAVDQNRAISVSRNQTQDLNAEIEILRSPDVFEKLIDEIGIEAFIPQQKDEPANSRSIDSNSQFQEMPVGINLMRDKVISNITRHMNVGVKRYTNIIEISYVSTDPELAYKVVSKIIDIFFEKHIKVHYSSDSYDFFNNQATDALKALNETEKKLAELKNKLNIGSSTEYRSILLERIKVIHGQIDDNNTAFAESKSKVQTLRNSLRDLPETIETERITGNVNTINEIYKLQLEEQKLLSKYSEDNVQIKEIRRQITEAKKLLNNESQINQGVNTTYQQLLQDLITEETNLASLQAKNDQQKNILSELKQELSQLNIIELEIGQLEREKDNHLAKYTKYSESLEESRVDQIVEKQKLSNIKILQAATMPVRPLAGHKKRNFALGIFMGFLGGIGLAFISEFMDHSIKKQEDVEKWLHLRTLAIIPEHPVKKYTTKKKK